MSGLSGSIREYQFAIDRAMDAISRRDVGSADAVLGALIIRDQIAHKLSTLVTADVTLLSALARQDGRLKGAASDLTHYLGRHALENWRETGKHPEGDWWWSLDKRAGQERSWVELTSVVLAWVVIALSLSFSLEIVRRYLNGGADFTSTVLQGVIALAAGSTIFRGAGLFVKSGSSSIAGFGFLSSHKSRWFVALLLLAVTVVLAATRQMAADKYNDRGVDEHNRKQLTRAIEKYQHAISLEPNVAEPHFNLGNAYEDVLQYDKAIHEYTEALLADQNFYGPYNNLARLYILQGNKYVDALKLVDKALALKLNPADADPAYIQYALYKNRAWANIGLKHYRQAQLDLAQALVKRRDGISAHCLLAQTLEATSNIDGAMEQWKLCRDLAEQQEKEMTAKNAFEIDEPEVDWLETAKERLGGK